ncbi:cytochrome P450 [Aspergillus falconensis]
MVRDIDHYTAPVEIGQWCSCSVLELSGMFVLGQGRGWLARYPDLPGSLKLRVATGQVKKMVLSIFPRPIRSLLMLALFGRKELVALEYLEYVARDLVQREKRKREKQCKSTDPLNLISAMLADSSIPEEQMLGHILVFLVGGSETTSSTFQWMIIELCRHPTVQTRLREELQAHWSKLSLLQGDTRRSLFSRIESLPYLRAVVDEVLRLHPAAMITQHEAIHDTTIAGVPIPKSTLLLCPPLAANLHPRLWGEDATAFNPDRWLVKRSGNQRALSQNPCANMTFSHGPRSCPGRSIARLMLMCLTAAFINEYEVSLADPKQAYAPLEAAYAKPTPELRVHLVKVIVPQ